MSSTFTRASAAKTTFPSVHGVFAERARRSPDHIALRTVTPEDSREFTYTELTERVSALRAGAFADVAAGERVVMALPGGVEYITGFLAALTVGAVPVPIYLPSGRDIPRYLTRAEPVLRDCAPGAVYTTSELAAAVAEHALLQTLPIRTADDHRTATPRETRYSGPDTVAFIQYSSGSTGRPKGVVNTHAAILRQIGLFETMWDSDLPVRTVSWLPLYHDMGMFWGVLNPLLGGGTATLLAPHDFVRDPRMWLRTVSEVRGNWIAAPDFGYRRATDASGPEDVAALDLRCLRIATNGAEPVRADTLCAFTERFAPAGLGADVVTPQYGLAEAGLAVSGTAGRRTWRQARFRADELARGRAVYSEEVDATARTLVSCGDSALGWDLPIVDPADSRPLPDGQVGEIWVGGPGLPQGYWRNPDATTATFRATTADGAGPYLRTGDAGFRVDGELYICGRYRDLIVIGGANHFPQDLEVTAAGCGPAVGAACAVQPDIEQPSWVLVAETTTPPAELDEMSRILHRRLLIEHETAPDRIVWVPPKTLPLTTSGKIRRREVSDRIGDGSLPVVREIRAVPGSESCAVRRYLAAALGLRPAELAEDADLVTLGLTSAMTAGFESWVRARGGRAGFTALYATPTLRAWRDLARPVPEPEPVAAVDGDSFPTTALQRAYWIGRDPRQPLGGVGCQTYFELVSPTLDIARCRAAVSGLARRHPMLRAHFPTERTCVIEDRTPPTVPVHDLTSGTDVESRLRATRHRLREYRFDPVAGDCWRIEVTVSPGSVVLHLAIDLIIADITGIGILVRDLAALYSGSELPPVDSGHAEVGAPVDGTAATQPPQLPTVAEHEPVFRRLSRPLAPPTLRGLGEAGRRAGVTRAVILLTCFDLVLRRWSAEPDFSITVTTSGRTPRTSTTVGDFTRARLHRAVLSAGDSWSEQMRRTQRAFRSDLAGPDAVTAVRADTYGISPIVFTYAADTPILGAEVADTLGSIREVTSRTPQVLIDNQCCALGDDVVVSWDFRSSRFPAGVVEDMFDAYVGLIEHVAQCDWQEAAAFDLSPRTRRTRELRNDTAAPLPTGLLYDRFHEIATATPERIAVRWAADEYESPPLPALPANSLTYGELDRYARRLASAISEHHPPGTVVGIRLPKGPAQLVAVLGVLMAGCVYLPVSVDQPPRRFERIRRRSGMHGLVHDGLSAVDATGLVEHPIADALRCVPRAPVRVDPAGAAYVIYTSGSTGEPKGVVISHTAALNTILDVDRRNGIGRDDTLLALSALDFDLSVYDIFGPLGCGGTVVTISEAARRDAFRWRDLLRAFDITVWNSVPGLLEMLLAAVGPGQDRLTGLRHVLLSGDWIPLDLPARLRVHASRARVVAMGGATEAAIWSNAFVVDEVDPAWPSVPYGFPLANQRYRVVDPEGFDRPDHVAGELWIGGAGVALGYHNDPELTAARFRLDAAGVRWYLTGDLGCYDADGVLRFLGRRDAQVKIRGYRVECGEIEAVLRTHPDIDGAVVVPVRGHAALGCLLVTDGDREVDARAFLVPRIPAYMTPTTFLRVSAIPRSANGKVDRRTAIDLLEREDTAPTPDGLTAVQDVVAGVWAEVLGIEPETVTAASSFLALGGDSLRATDVCRVLSGRGVVGAEVETLLSTTTLADFAAHCAQVDIPGVTPPTAPVAPGSFPLTRLQQGYVLGSAGLHGVVRAPTTFTVVLAAAEGATVDLMRWHRVLSDGVAEFDMLRCHLDSDVSQTVRARAETVTVTVVPGITDDPDALVEHTAGIESSPYEPPALRCWAAALAPRYVAVVINYLGLDARSIATVVDALRADYDGVARPVSIAAGAEVFRRFAETADDPDADESVDAPAPRIPEAWSGSDSSATGRFSRRGFTLDDTEYARLCAIAADSGVTPTAVILEAFTHALRSFGAGDRFAVSIPRSHRPDYAPGDVEVLGNFTRLYPCVADDAGHAPGSPAAIAEIQRRLGSIVGATADGTARIAHTRLRGREAGYPVVFTSTLGLERHERSSLTVARTLTRTPGVLLDCQIEREPAGIRLSWDTADDALDPDAMAVALDCFERNVRRHLRPAEIAAHPAVLVDDEGPLLVVAAALRHLDTAPVLTRYEPLVALWRGLPVRGEPTESTAAAGRVLAEIVTGMSSPRAALAHPVLSPEELFLAHPRVEDALAALADRVFEHARKLSRRLRIAEVGARTGRVTTRLHAALWPVSEVYIGIEPDPILRAIAADRAIEGVRQLAPEETAVHGPFDIVLCCASLHRLPEPDALIRDIPVRPDGWLWLTENHTYTVATLISAAVLEHAILDTPPKDAGHWSELLTRSGWQPVRVDVTGPSVMIHARPDRADTTARIGRHVPEGIESVPVGHLSAVELLTEIWQRHLGVRPRLQDDFFLLGGDSLTATRIYTELRAAGYDGLAMVDLFNHPVLRTLAAHLGTPDGPRPETAPDLPSTVVPTTYPLTPVQRAYASGREPGYLLSGVAAYCYFEFETAGLDLPRFEAAVMSLIQRHPGLRTTVRDGLATVHDTPIEPAVRIVEDVRAEMRDQVIDVTIRPGLDIGVQFLDPDHHRALVGVGMDNMLLDGASMMTALAELDHLHAGRGPLPPLRTTFAEYVHRGVDRDRVTAAQDYWRARLATLPPAPPLVTGAQLVEIERPVFDRVEATIDAGRWSALSDRCRSEGITPSALLLAAYAHVLSTWSGTPRFCLNVTLFDRDPAIPGIEHVIGDFTSLVLLECHVEPDRTLWELARDLQRRLMTDLPHRAADAVWLQSELRRHHGIPEAAMYPVVFTSGMGLRDLDATGLGFGRQVYAISQTPQTVLDFQVWQDGGALRLSWDHVTQAIPGATAARHLARLTTVLDSAHAPATDRLIAEICASALRRPTIDLGANFFRIGGDSVTATAVVERIQREITPVATVRMMLAHPVIADFAAALAQAMTTGPETTDDDVEEGLL